MMSTSKINKNKKKEESELIAATEIDVDFRKEEEIFEIKRGKDYPFKLTPMYSKGDFLNIEENHLKVYASKDINNKRISEVSQTLLEGFDYEEIYSNKGNVLSFLNIDEKLLKSRNKFVQALRICLGIRTKKRKGGLEEC